MTTTHEGTAGMVDSFPLVVENGPRRRLLQSLRIMARRRRSIIRANSSGVIPRTRNFFCRDVSPDTRLNRDFRSPSRLLNTSIIALLALPFSGDWVTETAACRPARRGSRSPSRRRCARTGRIVPSGCGCQVDHGRTPSNSAEPTRTIVAPSSMATS